MNHLAAIPFVHPGFAWAALGLALVPILIHILNRQRHRKVPWAAMMFLLAANKKNIRRTRFEQLLLLALRTLLIVLMGLALARPYLQTGATPAMLSRGTHHIIVLDDTYSMAAAGEATPSHKAASSNFDLQIERAQRLLLEVPSGDPITVITMGYPTRALNRQPMFDRTRVSRLLQTTSISRAHVDLRRMLQLVLEMIKSDREKRERAVYIFSDFTKSIFAGPADATVQPSLKSLARELAKGSKIILHAVGGQETANLANEQLRLVNDLVGAQVVMEIQNTIRNYSSRRSAEGTVQLFVDGKSTREEILPPLEPGESKTFLFAVEFDTPGLHTLESVLQVSAGNVLDLDDTSRLVVDVREQIPILVVDGKPGLSPLQGQAGYLTTALSPRIREQQQTLISPTVIIESEIAGQNLAPYDVIVLCNVRRLAADDWQRLEHHIHMGGGLLIYLGDLVEIENYNTAGRNLLPEALGEPAFPSRLGEEYVRFDPDSLGEPLLADFGGRKKSGLFQARVHQYIKLVTNELTRARTLLAYAGGDAAIVERSVGLGRCVLVNTTANMDWTNLPARGDFVTLSINLLQHIAPRNAANRNLVVGETFSQRVHTVMVPTGFERRVRRPDGSETMLEPIANDEGYQLQLDSLDQIGWYNLQAPGAEGPLAVNLDAQESNLTRLDETEIQRVLDCDFEYVAAEPEEKSLVSVARSEFASLMIYIVLMMLLVETLLSMLFGHHRSMTS